MEAARRRGRTVKLREWLPAGTECMAVDTHSRRYLSDCGKFAARCCLGETDGRTHDWTPLRGSSVASATAVHE